MDNPSCQASHASKAIFRGWRGIALLLLVAAASLWHLHIINRQMRSNQADLVSVWKGAQAALRHRNPYDEVTTLEIQKFYYGRPITPADDVNPMAFAYPMQTTVLFAPIAPLPWPVVRIGFFILLPLLTAASALLWLRVCKIDLTGQQLALTALFAVCSWPSLWGIHQIQPTLVVGFLAAAGCYFVQQSRGTAAGIVLALATIKPQLMAVLLAWIFLWAALRRTWSLFVSFTVTMAVLLAASERLLPHWLRSWRTATAQYAVYRHLQLELQTVFGHFVGLGLVATGAVLCFLILWKNRNCEPNDSVFGCMCALCLGLTLLILPSEKAMTYNYVLLIPAVLVLIHSRLASYGALQARRIALGFILVSFASTVFAVIGESFTAPSVFWDVVPFQTLLLPPTVLFALIFALLPQLRLRIPARTQTPNPAAAPTPL